MPFACEVRVWAVKKVGITWEWESRGDLRYKYAKIFRRTFQRSGIDQTAGSKD